MAEWTPTIDHELYERGDILKKQMYFEAFLKSITDFAIEKKAGRPVASFGQTMGRNYMRCLSLSPADPNVIRQVMYYKNVLDDSLGENSAGKELSGFTAELAAAELLTELEYKTYFSTTQEDLTKKIDFWINFDLPPDQNESTKQKCEAIAIQVKTLPLPTFQQTLYSFNSLADVNKMIQDLKNTADGKTLDAIEKIEGNLRYTAGLMLQETSQYTNVTPAFMILGTPESEGRQYPMFAIPPHYTPQELRNMREKNKEGGEPLPFKDELSAVDRWRETQESIDEVVTGIMEKKGYSYPDSFN